MAFHHRHNDRKRISHDYRRQEEEVVGSLCRLGSRPVSPKSLREQEKRIHREIANSNERRRMQSINAGFQSLRNLLPHREGEKLSKAAILQKTADYVYQLEREKSHLLEQNCQITRKPFASPQHNHDSDGSGSDSPLRKRIKREIVDSMDEGIGSSSPSRSENGAEDSKREISDLRFQLDQERTLRLLLEEKIRRLESRIDSTAGESDFVELIETHNRRIETVECLSAPNLGHEHEPGSPHSHVSSHGFESGHEIPLHESSPEHSCGETCMDLPEENITKEVELPSSQTSVVSGLRHPVLASLIPCEVVPVKQASSQISTSHQNLETIVEAIRHVEGYHLFKDDPKPNHTEMPQSVIDVKSSTFEQGPTPAHTTSAFSRVLNDPSLEYTIIRSASATQSRPGVIVHKL